jgi:hypothetical protein
VGWNPQTRLVRPPLEVSSRTIVKFHLLLWLENHKWSICNVSND